MLVASFVLHLLGPLHCVFRLLLGLSHTYLIRWIFHITCTKCLCLCAFNHDFVAFWWRDSKKIIVSKLLLSFWTLPRGLHLSYSLSDGKGSLISFCAIVKRPLLCSFLPYSLVILLILEQEKKEKEIVDKICILVVINGASVACHYLIL